MQTVPHHDEAATAVAVLDDDGLVAWIENELIARGIDPHEPDVNADGDPKAEAEPWPQPDPDHGEPEHLLDAEGWPLAIPTADLSGGDDATEEPDMLSLLYASKINAVSAHPGLGKTWVLLAMAAEVIDRAGRVVWIDGEDSPIVFARRMRTLGRDDIAASPALRWCAAEDWRLAGPAAQSAAAAWIASGAGQGHAFVDAASSTGAGETAEAFQMWRAVFLSPLVAAGVGATFADHLAKRRDADRLPSPLGSITKVAAITGASIELQGAAWTRSKHGTLATIIRKDRPGGLGQTNQTVARIVGTPHEETATLSLEVLPPADTAEHTADLVNRVWALLERDGERNTTQIVDALAARAQDVRAALAHLIDRGEVGVRTGAKNARCYSLVTPGATLFEPEQ